MESDFARLKAEIKALSLTLDVDEQKIITAVNEKFNQFEMSINTVANQITASKETAASDGESENQAQENQQNQAMMEAMAQMHQEGQATLQAALAAITESRQARTIQITAPSGAVYTGVSQNG